ncbi:MAG: hypothetical protein NUV98_01740 [Candidatus Roizmanbacteria bacterium]|nr:hypothetical protein [Candidatus Roizmanbacteria bacterium]
MLKKSPLINFIIRYSGGIIKTESVAMIVVWIVSIAIILYSIVSALSATRVEDTTSKNPVPSYAPNDLEHN